MPKKFKKAQNPCHSHLFSLKPDPKQTIASSNLNLTLSFCSQNSQAQPNARKQPKCLQAPLYNNDGSFASPAFTLPCDKSYYQERRTKMQEEHELRFAEFTDEKTELNVPKPKSKYCYCSVCRQYYDDYLDHIQSATHKNKCSSSPFSKHIQELARTFSKHRPLKKSYIQSQSSQKKSIIIEDIQDDSDEVQIISNPLKKIKTPEITITKDSNNPPLPSNPRQQTEQQQKEYYPFSNWPDYLNYEDQVKQIKPHSFNFNTSPFSFSKHWSPLGSTISTMGFQPFYMPSQSFQMLGLGAMPEFHGNHYL